MSRGVLFSLRKQFGIFVAGWGLMVAAFLLSAPQTVAAQEPAASALFQVSTLQALMEGCYDGVLSAAELRTHGNFGIGTFQGLDGEMVVFDGQVWQVRADGVIRQVPDETGIPFANVGRGMLPEQGTQDAALPVIAAELEPFAALAGLQKQLEEKIVNRNLPHLIVLRGMFAQVQTRSVPGQVKPYPRLAEVAKKQSVFRFEQVRGVLVGFWFPEYFKGINLPGFHLHFLSDDRKAGGHLLGISTGEKTPAALFPKADFRMLLPQTDAFAGKDIAAEHAEELRAVEGK